MTQSLTVVSGDERESFLAWISQLDFETAHENIYAAKHPGTGDWLFQSQKFEAWIKKPTSSLLWCHGKRKLHPNPELYQFRRTLTFK